jgi:hypothetical protein
MIVLSASSGGRLCEDKAVASFDLVIVREVMLDIALSVFAEDDEGFTVVVVVTVVT